jgi:WD40 repeat protein
LETGELIRSFPPFVVANIGGSPATVYYDVSPDGSFYAGGTWNGEINLINTISAQLISTFRAHPGMIHFLHFMPDGDGLVSAAADGIRYWDLDSGVLIHRYRIPEALPFIQFQNPVALMPDGESFLQLIAINSEVLHRDIASGEILRRITPNRSDGYIWSIDVSLDGSKALVAGDSEAWLYDIQTGNLIHSFSYPGTANGGHVDISPDGRTALITVWGLPDENVFLWDMNTGVELHRFPTSAGLSVYSSDGRRFVMGRGDGILTTYDGITYEEIRSFGMQGEGHTALIFDVQFSPDGSRLLSASVALSVTTGKSTD